MFNWLIKLLPSRKVEIVLKNEIIHDDVKQNLFWMSVTENPESPKKNYYTLVMNMTHVVSLNGVRDVVAGKDKIGTCIKLSNGKTYFSDEHLVDLAKRLKMLGYEDDDDDDDDDNDDDEPKTPPGPTGITKDEFEEMFNGK